MSERARFAVVLVVLFGATGLVLVTLPGDAPSDTAGGEVRRTVDGVKYTVHPSDLVQGCLTGRDCIPAIDDPAFATPENASIGPDARVVGLDVDGVPRAYPLARLAGHEVVNDRIAGRPVAVTYCPLCRSGIVFSRDVDDRTLSFGVSGQLLDANLVMYDRQTGTYWSQLRAEAIVGELVPAKLELLPSSITTWAEWRRGHPETVVLDGPGSIGSRDPYEGYRRSDAVGFGVSVEDDRLDPKAIVYGVAAGGAAVAYPESTLGDAGLVQDTVGEVPVLLVRDPTDGSVAAFDRRVDRTTLRFERTGTALVDGDGDRWNFRGQALEGPHEGTRLDRLDTHGFYWFAWRSLHPGTAVYRDAA